MLFIVISVIVPLAIYFLLPWLLKYATKKEHKPNTLLITACILYFISWYLPSPLIEGENTHFTTHFIGGGIFTGFLGLYIYRQLQLNLHPLTQMLALYALVSALGVANELFELAVTQLNLTTLTPEDTWWDLLANTLGALTFFIGYQVFKKDA